jgi:hypothetical protein
VPARYWSASVQRPDPHPEFERRLGEIVRRLADAYGPEVGIGHIVSAVSDLRASLILLAVREPDGGLRLIERLARHQLDQRTGRAEGRAARLMPESRPGRTRREA